MTVNPLYPLATAIFLAWTVAGSDNGPASLSDNQTKQIVNAPEFLRSLDATNVDAAHSSALGSLPLKGAAAKRYRVVDIDIGALWQLPMAPLTSHSVPLRSTLRLSLFPDISLVARNSEVEETSEGEIYWEGQIIGDPFSRVKLTVTAKGECEGVIISQAGHFNIQPIDNSPYHIIYESDYEAWYSQDQEPSQP